MIIATEGADLACLHEYKGMPALFFCGANQSCRLQLRKVLHICKSRLAVSTHAFVACWVSPYWPGHILHKYKRIPFCKLELQIEKMFMQLQGGCTPCGLLGVSYWPIARHSLH